MKPAESEQNAPIYKANGRRPIFENEEQNENDHGDRADRDHLTIQIRLGAFLNGSGDLLHPLIACGRPNHRGN